MNFFDDYSMTIDGQSVRGPRTMSVINPATETILAKAPDATSGELDAAVAAARRAFAAWCALPIRERQRLVSAIGDRIEAEAERFIRLLTLEQGKPRTGGQWEVGGSVVWCREIAKHDLPLQGVEETAERRVTTRRVPVGVVGAITPWNYPLLLAIWKIAPALVAGNTMVLKPSPYTPLCTLKLGELLRDLLPPGVLNVVCGGDDLGRWMTAHPDIAKISFTGSCATGKKIMQSAAGSLKRITLELGGNDPAIVLPDVHVPTVVRELFWAAFQNSAQICVAAKRMYIHEDIYDEFTQALVTYARSLKVGNGLEPDTDLGPIQNRMQYEKLTDLLADTRRSGARFLLGGAMSEGPGYFMPITLVDNPADGSRVVVEEAFGPILPLLKFRDVDEVVRRANDTTYGLAGSVWSADIDKARAMAERLECGQVWINEIHTFSPHAAFGAHKQSGVGIANAMDGLLAYTNPQTISARVRPESAPQR
jgi:acyl-CoA reductase-like NAD-dependent aldehyde dehydrogenase